MSFRKVEIRVYTDDKKDQRAVPITKEVDRGAGQIRLDGIDYVCNSASVTIELKPGERLVIDGYEPQAVAYDRDQAAAYHPHLQKTDGIDPPKELAQFVAPTTSVKPVNAQTSNPGQVQKPAGGTK